MKAVLTGTYGKTIEFGDLDRLPKVGDNVNGSGYENAKISRIENINDRIAETTSGDPKATHNFYRLVVEMDGEEFYEYVAVEKRSPQKRYDARMTKYYSLKLNKKTDAEIIAKLASVDSVQGYIKDLIRKDIEN